jgi:hypothetical protein
MSWQQGPVGLFDLYCSDIAFSISLVIAWELVIVVFAMWLVPWVLAMAAAAGQLGDPALPIGGI